MRIPFRYLVNPRRAWIRLSILAAASVACLALAAWLWHRARAWPETAIRPLQDPLANLNQTGVNVDLDPYSPEELEQALDRIEAAGFDWVRQRFPWYEIEPERGAFEWATWDAIVAACESRGLRLIAVVDGSPFWARPGTAVDSPLTPPREVEDWGAFTARLAERYRGRIDAYQLWDEPNLADHWGNQYVDPAAYVALLREGAIQIRDADRGAVVLLAALAPTTESGPLNLNEVAFVEQVLDAGGRSFFDAVAVQPYGFGSPPDARADPARLDFGRAALVRRALVGRGFGDCPVWATAGGWNALPSDWDGRPSLWPALSENDQTEYTLDALRMVRREWPWMGPLILYTYQPDLPADDPYWGFALVDAEDHLRHLYGELRRHNAERQPLHTGVYAARPENAQYTGEWRFSSAGADPPQGAGAAERNAVVAFDLYGTSLDLTVRRGDFWGLLYVAVDGRPASGLPRDEKGQAYLVLYDPMSQVETVRVADGLAAHTSHHVEIVAHGGWGQWPLAGWAVHQEEMLPPRPAVVGVFALLGVGTALLATAQAASAWRLRQPVYALAGHVFRTYRALPEWVPVLATGGAAVAFYLVPWTPVSFLLLAALFVLFFLRVDLALATVAFALPFYLEPKTLLGRPFSVVELGVWLCALAWLAARLLDLGREADRNAPLPPGEWLRQIDGWLIRLPARLWRDWSSLDKGMAALVLVAATSVSWAPYPHVSVYQAAVREFRTVFAESALFYGLIRLSIRSPRAHRRLIEGWLLGATAIALVSIGQVLGAHNLISAEGVWRVRGFYGSPNNLALYLERALPVLIALAWQGIDQAQVGRSRDVRRRRILYGVAALPVLVALVMTLSKGALLLGVPTALLVLVLLQRDRRLSWTAAGVLAIVALLVSSLAYTERFGALLDLTRGTGFLRLKLWRATLTMIADHPLTGVGLDGFLYAYRTRYVLPLAWQELNLSHPHNLLLDSWTRLGIGGVAVIAWLLVHFFRATGRRFRTLTGSGRALLLGIIAAMAATLAHGMVDHAVFVVDLAFVFAMLIAMADPAARLS